jgi:DNA-binding NarL/FixJ family response regulator
MKLLIVEDEPQIAEMLRGMLHLIDKRTLRQIETIDLADNLADATTLLWTLGPGDAVICDGRFPTGVGCQVSGVGGNPNLAPGTWNLTPRLNWPHIAGIAEKIGAIFVLYSGDAQAVERAHSRGMLAFSKPALAETLYQAIIQARAKWGMAA